MLIIHLEGTRAAGGIDEAKFVAPSEIAFMQHASMRWGVRTKYRRRKGRSQFVDVCATQIEVWGSQAASR
jgi:hypothetical protein